ncbi:hypothetical protein DT076_05450 [Desertihabitans brevis]|uniref:WD40 repeat domain-containing protein n=1 Tax=Desertihabitans brevis TaxID=2268447 RepID=A0A367YYB7_9ACTN|nr:hypothetical protein DT076_05450 [Desertihabitans brevis]
MGATLLCLPLALPAVADEVEFTIADEDITESSGLATDRQQGLYWTVNDSGDEARAFALDEDGQTEGVLTLRADVTDVEAVARTSEALYLGDIGDNDREREFVTVYRVADPEPGTTPTYNAWDLEYADGEAHDAEAMVVLPSGRVLLVTKEQEGGIWATSGTLSGQQVNTLERVADAPSFVTDATLLSDGRIAVRSYVSVTVLDEDYETEASAALPLQQQGESITEALDGDGLLIGSEGEGSQVLRVPVPEAVAEDVPAGDDSPPESAEPAPSGEATPDAAPEEEEPAAAEEGDDRSGTLLALGLAALVAVAAGLVVAFARPRGGTAAAAAAPVSAVRPQRVGEDRVEGAPAAAADPGPSSPDTAPEESAPAAEPADAGPTDAGPADAGAGAPAPFPVTSAEGDYHLTAEQPGRVTWSEPASAGSGPAPSEGAGAAGRETSGGAGADRDDLEWLYEERGR